jgi:hypothetical protein
MEKEILACWTDDIDMDDAMNEERILVLNTVAKRVLFKHSALELPTVDQPATGRELIVRSSASFDISENPEGTAAIMCREETMKDFIYLMNPTVLTPSKRLESSLKVIPVMGLELSRLLALLPDLQKALENGKITNGKDAMANIGKNFDFFRDFHGRTITNIAALLGLDVAVKEEITTIPSLVNAIWSGAPAWVAKTALGAGIVATAAFVVSSVMHEVTRIKNERVLLGRQIVANLHDAFYLQYMEHFDRSMEYLRTCIIERMQEKHHLDRGVAQLEGLRLSENLLRSTISEMREQMSTRPHGWSH